MAAVAAPILSPLDRIDLWVANDLVHVLHGPRTIDLDAPVGTTVSLVPLVGSVEGVTSTDLRWNLNDETLNSNRARGVSNVIVGSARIDVRSGVLAVIIPARTFVDTTTAVQAHHDKEQP
jgi:thiamine pyrophosphokinase